MIGALKGVMQRTAQQSDMRTSPPKFGIVSSYDPANYAVKVRLQPENIETGWLPVGSEFVGNGWGLFAGPSPGDVVEVHFQEGSQDAGYVTLRFFGDQARPLPVPSGEFWIVHKGGSFLKFHNDGSVEMSASILHLHASTSYRWDVHGYGQSITWTGGSNYQVDNFTIGANVTSVDHNIDPPETP